MKMLAHSLLLLLVLSTANAAVTGRVINRTTGQPAAGVPVTLIKMQISMDPVDEVFTNDAGEFSFDDDLLDASGARTVGMLRAEHQSVNYSHMLGPMMPKEGVEVEIFDSVTRPLPPVQRIVILEPGPEEVVINESYLFSNDEVPPVTFRNPVQGALQFYLPEEAKGIVEVQGVGPAGMSLNAAADPTDEPGWYKVDFPIKPGSNRIGLSYVAARPPDGEALALPTRYPNAHTRIAAPAGPGGVQLSGPNLTTMGVEPQMQVEIFDLARGTEAAVMIEGSLAPQPAAAVSAGAGGGSPNQISVENAPIAAELWWILAVIAGILGIGFYNLNTSKA
jgi:5-hydroxyisourate hydrolase-like protein (transthyretin family)